MTMAAAFSPSLPSVQIESDTQSGLARWLVDQLTKACARVMLAQRISEHGLQTVDEWSLADLCDPNALAQVIHGAALREAQTIRASTAYGVFALRDDRPEPMSRFLFRIEAGASWMQSAETGDERDFTSMALRHSEAAARLALGHSRGILDQYERFVELSNSQQGKMLDRAYKRIEILETREIEALELRGKLQALSSERDAEVAGREQRHKLQLFALEKFAGWLPLLVTGIAAARRSAQASAVSGISPPGAAPGAADVAPAPVDDTYLDLLQELVTSISTEQLPKIAELLTPKQVEILMTLFDLVNARMVAKKAAQNAATSQAPPGAASPAESTRAPTGQPEGAHAASSATTAASATPANAEGDADSTAARDVLPVPPESQETTTSHPPTTAAAQEGPSHDEPIRPKIASPHEHPGDRAAPLPALLTERGTGARRARDARRRGEDERK